MGVGSKNSGGLNDPKGFRVRMKGSHFSTVTAGNMSNLDYQIEQLNWIGTNKQSYFDGVEYYAKDAEIGDTVKFQVIDKDGIAYPAGTVLEEFANIYVIPNNPTNFVFYKAKLIPGMYIRIIYNSTGTNDIKFICNIFRHLNSNEDS